MKKSFLKITAITAILCFTNVIISFAQTWSTAATSATPVTTESEAIIGTSNPSSTTTTPTTKLLIQEDNPMLELSDVTGSNTTTSVGLQLTIPSGSYQFVTSFNNISGPQLHIQRSTGGCGFHITGAGLYIGSQSGYCPNFPTTITTALDIFGNTTLSASSSFTVGGTSQFNGSSNTFSNKVVIGNPSTTPGTYKLYVTDGILTEKVKVALKTGTDWADYVFDSQYKLISLTEVEKYIRQNKHLPNVPSADELVNDGGIDVAKMDATLLQKIEELTLYMIELKKENESMKERLQALEKKK